jgi:hypothetical protein
MLLETKRKYKRLSFKEQMVWCDKFLAEGLKKQDFCEKHDLHIKSLEAWMTKYNKKKSKGDIILALEKELQKQAAQIQGLKVKLLILGIRDDDNY